MDVLIVHDKERGLKFIKDRPGLKRRRIAYNYFYLIGPKDDSAGVKGVNAFLALAKSRSF